MSTLVFNAEEIERKTTQKGKNFLRVKVQGGPWTSVWDPDDANLILSNDGATFKGDIKEDGDFKNLENVTLAGDGEQASGANKSTLSKEEWAAKDRKDWLRRLYISHLGNLTQIAAAAQPVEVGFGIYQQCVGKARGYANSDLQWIEGGGTEEPF